MNRLARIWLFGALTLGVCLLAAPVTRCADDDDDDKDAIKGAQKATEKLNKLIEAIAAGKTKDVSDTAKALDEKTDLKPIMWAAYKPRDKGGIGVGPKAAADKSDGIEAKVIELSKKPLSAEQLKKESADLIRMAQVAQAMNEIAQLKKPTKNLDMKRTVAVWTKFNKQQKDGAQDLIDAVSKNNPKAVQIAATNLYSSCTNCHATFRD